MSNYQFYHDLIQASQNAPVKYESASGHFLDTHKMHSLKMLGHYHPWSLKPNEFFFIGDFIRKHGLKAGYEIATGFGISSLGAALGFKDTGGKLVTMDAYIEEANDNCAAYTDKQGTYADSDGYKSVMWLREHYGLQDVLFPKVGWSPDDAPKSIISVFGEQGKIDYAFIDGLHTEDAVIKDTLSIKPFLADKFVVFYHDGAFQPGLISYLQKELGFEYRRAPECHEPLGFVLSYITNLE
jgi:hypothetical protein